MMICEPMFVLLLRQQIANTVTKPDLQILTALSVCAGHYGKLYCYPAQDKILAWLARAGRRMSRRTLNRHLRTLEQQGFIRRQRRHQNCPQRGMVFRSTLYQLTRRALHWLAGMASIVKRAASFFGSSRVPNPAQHCHQKKINPGAVTQKPGEPPPEGKKVLAADGGEAWDKKKAAAEPHLADLRRLLA